MRKVTTAQLHTSIFVPGVGQFGPNVNVDMARRDGKIKTLTMEWNSQEGTLDLTVNGKLVGIPHANVQSVLFSPEGDLKPSTSKPVSA